MAGMKYNVDIVMCIDCTGSMHALLETVKGNALRFYPDLKKRCEAKGKDISQVRIRVIGFRDFGVDGSSAIADSGFFSIPENENAFKNFVGSFTPTGGGDEPESGLETLAMAIDSDWTTGGDKRRHIIVVWTDASTHDLGTVGMGNPLYPDGIPSDLDDLTDWWEDTSEEGKMDANAKRLVLFAPDAKSWNVIGGNWSNTIYHPAEAGTGLSEFDYETILRSIVESV
ncbi:MAG: VWA domain-containing protein [Bacteroidales bacterium]|nr:VWA domain-containing protein [Bacteroidales bacterium]